MFLWHSDVNKYKWWLAQQNVEMRFQIEYDRRKSYAIWILVCVHNLQDSEVFFIMCQIKGDGHHFADVLDFSILYNVSLYNVSYRTQQFSRY